MSVVALFAVVKRWKQPRCPLMDEWMSEMWSLYTVNYYLSFKRKEIMTHAATWMKLEDMMLSEISQSQKDILCNSTLTRYLE